MKTKITEIKNKLDAELNKYYRKRGKSPIKKKKIDSEYGDESNYEEDRDDDVKAIKSRYRVPSNTWIIKPGEDTNRGRGINVASELDEIRNLCASTANGS